MAKKKINYSEAFAEAQAILLEIENNEIDIDTLAEKVKRAAELLKTCKAKLVKTESDLNQIFEDLTD